ncbi:MAG: hypothetical protein KGK17_04780 [Betaproteobacteria bacterium]|nr:hypothetical protein [Betaproteobacteria bacterium]
MNVRIGRTQRHVIILATIQAYEDAAKIATLTSPEAGYQIRLAAQKMRQKAQDEGLI